MRIPLIFRLPGGERGGERVSRQATLMDLMPTLLELAGGETLPLPASGYGGHSLLPMIQGALPRSEPERAVFGETGYCFFPQLNDRLLIKPLPRSVRSGNAEKSDEAEQLLAKTDLVGRLRMIRRDGWKLILTPAPDGADLLELYDLRGDPEELVNLIGEQPDLAASMLAELRQWMAADRGQPDTGGDEFDQAAIERLKSLGYIQ